MDTVEWITIAHLECRVESKISINYLVFKYLYLFGLHDQIGEFSFEPGGPYDMVIYPMVIASPGLAHKHTMIFKAMFA